MAWIESHQELREHPKTKKLARLLGVSKVTAIGHLHCLWWWSLDYAQDGDLRKFENPEIADAAGWEGDSDIFVDAMRNSGFIDADENNAAGAVHDWDTYAGRLIQKREQNAEKQREWRLRNRPEKGTETPPDDDPTPRNDHVTVTQPTRDGATVPNRTVPNHVNPQPPSEGDYPAEFEDRFWRFYPKGRGSKSRAFKIWKRLSAVDKAAITAALPAFAASRDWREGFQSGPEVWLGGRCWENPPVLPGSEPVDKPDWSDPVVVEKYRKQRERENLARLV